VDQDSHGVDAINPSPAMLHRSSILGDVRAANTTGEQRTRLGNFPNTVGLALCPDRM
jgi:hypothetical protein